MTVDDMIRSIIAREGGFVDHPKDRGGPTKYGITLRTLARYIGWPTANDVERITEHLAALIYRHDYYQQPGFNQLPCAQQPFLLDAAVNHGPTLAIKMLQEVCNKRGHHLKVDGILGPNTRAAASSAPLSALVEHRRQFYHAIVENDPSQRVFLAGWLNRLEDFT